MLFDTLDPSVASLVARLTAEYGLIEPADIGIQSLRGSRGIARKAINLAS